VRARNINTSIEDNFTLILDPVLRDKRLAKELKIKKAKEAKLAKAKKTKPKTKVNMADIYNDEWLLARIEKKNFSYLSTQHLKDMVAKYEKQQKVEERRKKRQNNPIAKFFEKFKKDLKKAAEVHRKRFPKKDT
jgi:hypothetical protein